MRLEPMYRMRFGYPEQWGVAVEGAGGRHEQYFFVTDGRCEGRIAGRFHGANHPQWRTDETFVPDVQGVVETDDGATVYLDLRGYGRAYPAGRRQIVGTVTHLADDERYRWLNDAVGVLTGEVRAGDEEPNP